MRFVDVQPGARIELARLGSLPDQIHVFDEDIVQAVNAALAARRPLLARGEPGVGKSQLARAVAKHLGRAYVQHVVDARTESNDLLWHFDAVERLAEAQLAGALREDPEAVRRRLMTENFLRPGPLWWAFDWKDAEKQARLDRMSAPPQPDGGDPERGCVVLVDEIDKAETDVPNGLLEALGAGAFKPFGRAKPVVAVGPTPLVVITTNEERALPDAFIRRCLVLFLELPKPGDALIKFLVQRGRAHFPAAAPEVLAEAAKQLDADRQQAIKDQRLPLPGQAEYLDLVRAVLELAPDDPARQVRTLKSVAPYVVQKLRGAT